MLWAPDFLSVEGWSHQHLRFLFFPKMTYLLHREVGSGKDSRRLTGSFYSFLRVEGLIKQQTQLYTVKVSVNDLAAVLK